MRHSVQVVATLTFRCHCVTPNYRKWNLLHSASAAAGARKWRYECVMPTNDEMQFIPLLLFFFSTLFVARLRKRKRSRFCHGTSINTILYAKTHLKMVFTDSVYMQFHMTATIPDKCHKMYARVTMRRRDYAFRVIFIASGHIFSMNANLIISLERKCASVAFMARPSISAILRRHDKKRTQLQWRFSNS